jgi:hypothetical protein
MTDPPAARRGAGAAGAAAGWSVIKCATPLSVRKDTNDHSWYWTRAGAYQHLMADSPRARLERERERFARAEEPAPEQ